MRSRLAPGFARPCLALAPLLAMLGCGADPGAEVAGSLLDARVKAQAPCFVPPACDAAPPATGAAAGFRRSSSRLKAATGKANHRVHDLLLAPSDPQWVIGTFAYDGLGTASLEGEDVDVYVLRGCGAAWELLGTAVTTNDRQHATVEGVVDSGGLVYLEVPPSRALGVGRHRVRLVVRGDLSAAEGFIEVQPPGTGAFVADIDGTLTPSDAAEFFALLGNTLPDASPGAADALGALARQGYRPIYLTARTGSELARTRAFLAARGFPAGLVRTSRGNGLIGLSGAAAVSFKAGELARVQGHGFTVAAGIGNADTDARAYQQAGLPATFMYRTDAGAPYGGRRFEDYASLVELAGLPARCAAP